MFKKLLIGLSFFVLSTTIAVAQVSVDGYTRSDGTYVQPHTRSSPNGTVRDNYSYKGNRNPYTGQTGTNRYPNNPTSEYYEGPSSNSTPSYGNSGNYGYGGR